jgi:tetratricopeptide (TPR) repeat protein
MTKRALLAAACLMLLPSAWVHADELSTVRSLYASAAYEEALALLDKVRNPAEPAVIEQYKALCYLALGRSTDAERTLEGMLRQQPRFEFGEADVSPRLTEMFQAVRKRILPEAARALYARGKSRYDAKRFDEAVKDFRELVALSTDEVVAQNSAVGDLRQLGEGFLKLAEAEVTRAAEEAKAVEAARVEAERAAASAAVTSSGAAQFSTRSPVTYTPSDADVVPPVETVRNMPRWVPGNPLLRQAVFRGVLELVIDEQGAVESAQLLTSVSPLYDGELLEATAGWRFRPATKDGRPVRYRKTMQIVLQPAAK